METFSSPSGACATHNRFSKFCWNPVLAGAVVAVSLQIMFSFLGAAIGSSTVNPLAERNPLEGLSTFASYWWIFSGLLSLAVGGFIAGKSALTVERCEGRINGLVTWSVVNIFAALVAICTAGSALSGAGKILSGGLSIAAAGAGGAAPVLAEQAKQFMPPELSEINTAQMRSELDMILKGNSSADSGLSAGFDALFKKDAGMSDAADKEALANMITARSSLSREEAMQAVNNWQTSYNAAKIKFEAAKVEAEKKAREAGDRAAKAATKGAVILFFMLLLGAVATSYAGSLGVQCRLNHLEAPGRP